MLTTKEEEIAVTREVLKGVEVQLLNQTEVPT